MEQTPFELTSEQKGMLATLSRETGKPIPALLAEVIATAILVFTIFGVTDKKADQSWAGATIGLVLAAAIWVFGPISGASLNPARTFGPTIVSAAAFSVTPLGSLWIYAVGPVLGGLLGAFLYDAIRSA